MKYIIFTVIANFLMWLVFSDFLKNTYGNDPDKFWIIVSVYGFLFLVFVAWMSIEAKKSQRYEDPVIK
jgi:hypothetical protein